MLRFMAKEYKWGYTLWINTPHGKKQLASKLKSFDDVSKFIGTNHVEVLK